MHDTGVPELAHAGIDDGVTGFTTLPALQCGFIIRPRKIGIFWLERLIRKIWKVMQQVIRKFTPENFLQKLFTAAIQCAACARHGAAGCVPNLMRADFAPMQMRREARG